MSQFDDYAIVTSSGWIDVDHAEPVEHDTLSNLYELVYKIPAKTVILGQINGTFYTPLPGGQVFREEREYRYQVVGVAEKA